ncbi:terpene synthase family protein [Kitasatospora sp. NPDC001574]
MSDLVSRSRDFVATQAPLLRCPFPAAQAPVPPSLERDLEAWCAQSGLYSTFRSPEQIPVLLRRYQVGDWTTKVYPLVTSRPAQWLMTRHSAWETFIEWIFDENTGEPERLSELYCEPICRVLLAADIPHPETVASHEPAVRAIASLTREVDDLYGSAWRRIWAASLARTVEHGMLETARGGSAALTMAAYLRVRPRGFGIENTTFLALADAGIKADARFLAHICAEAALGTANLHSALVNDILGVLKEADEGNIASNSIVMHQHQYNSTFEDALTVVRSLCNDQIQAYLVLEQKLHHIAEVSFPDELPQVASYCKVLRAAMRGYIEYHTHTARYSEWQPGEFENDTIAREGAAKNDL